MKESENLLKGVYQARRRRGRSLGTPSDRSMRYAPLGPLHRPQFLSHLHLTKSDPRPPRNPPSCTSRDFPSSDARAGLDSCWASPSLASTFKIRRRSPPDSRFDGILPVRVARLHELWRADVSTGPTRKARLTDPGSRKSKSATRAEGGEGTGGAWRVVVQVLRPLA
jgi:hypothetical protein